MTSYLVGRLIPQRSPDARALAWVRRHGAPVTFLAFSAAGRLARYAVVALFS
jgi:hypothetical protein